MPSSATIQQRPEAASGTAPGSLWVAPPPPFLFTLLRSFSFCCLRRRSVRLPSPVSLLQLHCPQPPQCCCPSRSSIRLPGALPATVPAPAGPEGSATRNPTPVPPQLSVIFNFQRGCYQLQLILMSEYKFTFGRICHLENLCCGTHSSQ